MTGVGDAPAGARLAPPAANAPLGLPPARARDRVRPRPCRASRWRPLGLALAAAAAWASVVGAEARAQVGAPAAPAAGGAAEPAPEAAAFVAEAQALEAEARLDHDAALAAYRTALEAATRVGAWHAAEVYARALVTVAAGGGRFVEAAVSLERLAEAPGTPPVLAALARWHAAGARWRLGERDRAEALAARLGLVQGFQVIGPFDNERGGGFAKAYPPEAPGLPDLAQRHSGKAREVGWRAAPEGALPLGVLDLDALLRPNDEVLAYALALVRYDGPTARWAALRVASDEGLAAFWNDRAVLARDVYRHRSFDQDVAPVLVRPGWNKLLLKVAERRGPWAVSARLTAPDGGPLDFAVAAPEEIPGLAYATPPVDPSEAAPPPEARPLRGAIDVYLARAAAPAGATRRDAFHLGLLHQSVGAHDEGEHPAEDAYRRALALEAGAPAGAAAGAIDDATVRVRLASTLDRSGELDASRELNPQRLELERALAVNPRQARAALALARYYLDELQSPDLAEPYLALALQASRRAPAAGLLELDLLAERGHHAVARARLRELSIRPGAMPAALRRAAFDLPEAGVAELERALALDREDQALRERLVALLRIRDLAGDAERQEALLREGVAQRPQDGSRRASLAGWLAGRGRLAEAATELEETLRICPEDDARLDDLGRLYQRMGETDRAVARLEAALALDPGRTGLESYLDLLREAAAAPEEEYRDDPERVVAAARALPLDPQVATRELSRLTAFRIHADGTSTRFDQRIARIENRDGLAREQRQVLGFAQGEQEGRFRRAAVWKPDGRRLEARVDQARGTGGSVTVALPVLEVGDVIVIEARTTDLAPTFFGDYFGHTHVFRGQDPVERSRLVLLTPAGRHLHLHLRGAPEPALERRADGLMARSFALGPFPRLDPEPGMPGWKELEPIVEASTFRDWKAFGAWYWNLVKRQRELGPELRAKALELTREAATREDKVRAIYRFVVQEIRYNDHWEFGVHGFKPYNAATIFQRRFGDCKDKATLINTMLDAVGIESWPVLIGAHEPRPREDLALPLISHFNHCIAFVPDAPGSEEGWFLDGTASHHRADSLPPMDMGARVFIVRPDGGALATIAFAAPLAEHGVRERWELAVREDGSAEATLRILPVGGFDAMMRGAFVNEAKRADDVERFLQSRYAGLEVLELASSPLLDLDRPVEIEARVRIPLVLDRRGDGALLLEARSVLVERLIEARARQTAALGERRFDLLLPVPSGGEETAVYALPPGLAIEALPPPVALSSPFGTYERRYTRTADGKLEVRRQLVIAAQRIPAADYPAWRGFATDIERAEEARVRLTRARVER